MVKNSRTKKLKIIYSTGGALLRAEREGFRLPDPLNLLDNSSEGKVAFRFSRGGVFPAVFYL